MKIMSIIGIVLSVVGLYFALSFLVAGSTNESIGLGFITLILNGYFLALSIVALGKSKLLPKNTPAPATQPSETK